MPPLATYEIKTMEGQLLRTGQTPAIVSGLPPETYTVTILGDHGWSAFRDEVTLEDRKRGLLGPSAGYRLDIGTNAPVNGASEARLILEP